jgi:hypothetical protein
MFEEDASESSQGDMGWVMDLLPQDLKPDERFERLVCIGRLYSPDAEIHSITCSPWAVDISNDNARSYFNTARIVPMSPGPHGSKVFWPHRLLPTLCTIIRHHKDVDRVANAIGTKSLVEQAIQKEAQIYLVRRSSWHHLGQLDSNKSE